MTFFDYTLAFAIFAVLIFFAWILLLGIYDTIIDAIKLVIDLRYDRKFKRKQRILNKHFRG